MSAAPGEDPDAAASRETYASVVFLLPQELEDSEPAASPDFEHDPQSPFASPVAFL